MADSGDNLLGPPPSKKKKKTDDTFTFRCQVLGASEVTANLYCNCVHLHWEGCVIFSIYCGNI